MKKFILILCLMTSVLLQAQEVYKYWISFTDKSQSPYSLSCPEDYLSPRSIARRQRFNIAIDSLDLPVLAEYVQAVHDQGFVILNTSKWLNGVTAYALNPDQESLVRALPFVSQVKLYEVASMEVEMPIVDAEGTPYDPTFQHGDDMRYYGLGYENIHQLHGEDLHLAGYQGQGVLVGVLDGGFPGVETMEVFDSLRTNGQILATRDFVWPGQSVYTVHHHGTLVLSALASNLPGVYVGTAPRARYVLCRTENTYTETPLEEYNYVSAAEYLDSLGADMMTASLGYYDFDDPQECYSLEVLDGRTSPSSRGAAVAASRGMLVINAAGNDGMAAVPHLGVPADVETVLSIGAVDIGGQAAFFTSPGPTADGRTKPDIAAHGVDVPVAMPGGGYHRVNGTSLATPIAAGMMACLIQRYPQLSPQQLCDSVRAWGSVSSTPNCVIGYGIPDFGRAVHGVRDTTAVGVCTAQQSPQVRILPNPAHHQVTVSGLDGQESQIEFYDAVGRLCLQQSVSSSSESIPLHLARGVYCVRIRTAGTVVLNKLLVD